MLRTTIVENLRRLRKLHDHANTPHRRAYRDTHLQSEFLSEFFAPFALFAVNYPIPTLFFGCGGAALGLSW